jgi:hypothetical protein
MNKNKTNTNPTCEYSRGKELTSGRRARTLLKAFLKWQDGFSLTNPTIISKIDVKI